MLEQRLFVTFVIDTTIQLFAIIILNREQLPYY